MAQIPGDDFVFIAGVLGQGPHDGQMPMLRRQHAANMQKRLCLHGRKWQTQHIHDALFAAQRQRKFPELGLGVFDQTRQRNGGAHIAERIVRVFMRQAICCTQKL